MEPPSEDPIDERVERMRTEVIRNIIGKLLARTSPTCFDFVQKWKGLAMTQLDI